MEDKTLELINEWFDENKTQIKKEYSVSKNWMSKDLVQGRYVEYHQNGKIALEGYFVANEKHGKFISFDEQGD